MNRVTKKLAPGRVSVPTPRILGQLNFSLVDIGKACSLCEKTFKDHWNLKRHLQRCHDITEMVADDMSIVQETEYQDIQTSDSPKNPLTPSESVEEESDVDNEYYNSILNYDECEESDDGSRVDNSDFDVEENTEPNASIPLFNHILNNILDVTLSDSTKFTASLNLPSEHIKLLAANPIKSKSIFSLPDRMPNQSVCLQQGAKWRTNPYFQQPMFTHNNIDFWSGDIVLLKDCSPNIRFLMESFHTMDTSNVFSRGYIVQTPKDGCSIGIKINHTDINIESFLSVDTTPLNTSLCCSISPDTIILLIPTHCDTSGNTSKQFNPYESWSMKCAALSFEERCSIENILFISAIPKKKGANATLLLSEIVDDLKKLENGVVMFSAEDNAYILVVPPLLWIEADTFCHSELCGLGAPNSTYPCRKHSTRTKDHYIQAASTPDRDTVIPDIPYFDDKNTAEELSFKNKSTDKLLELKAYDQSKDTSAEILHYILLGIAKYLITDLVKVVLNKNKKELEELFYYIKDYKNSRGISRAFTRSLTHAGLFLSRDFKVLIQILPVILAIKFADTEVLQKITPLFVRLSRLCSLIFVRSIDSQYETYISEVDTAVRSLIEVLHKYDTNCKHKKHAFYTSKPKVHLLTHLPEDLRRFEPALNYETKKGEQFNKHIREHLFHTNR
ncbi:C2H2-type zinc finger transcription factor [Phycomyces blakesleeanus]|uniref:C2H2-type zinc finger transcription factor n=2 Tax=Phycomyces blakesleeanus TaxID=4837 RepID=A0A163DJ58_PHYB8|nr:C2H2-type zinc finger transcription factor [Phycomyces blakesleeanus NRRL 1555(-)]OAD71600.1 C2H2-type zinc finger transcription factor [Phycomyces blakesleeanus NRRL 1555(-)]|eukprot:XP_018289640.1 C2H2-type zinc finger transcription factor [Phycomyces blakesleeanus NRRL 1555(-)]